MSVQGKNRLGHQFLEGKFKYTKNPQHLADYLYYSCVYRSLSHPLLEKHYDLEAIEDRPFVRVSKFLSGVTFAGIADRFLFSTSLPSLKATVMRFLLGIGVASSLGFSVGKAFNHLPRDFLARSSYAALNLDKRTPLGDVAYHCYNSTDYFRVWTTMATLTDEYGDMMGDSDKAVEVLMPKDPREGIAHFTAFNFYWAPLCAYDTPSFDFRAMDPNERLKFIHEAMPWLVGGGRPAEVTQQQQQLVDARAAAAEAEEKRRELASMPLQAFDLRGGLDADEDAGVPLETLPALDDRMHG